MMQFKTYLLIFVCVLSCHPSQKLGIEAATEKSDKNDDLRVNIRVRGDSNHITVIQYMDRTRPDTIRVDSIPDI